MTQLFASEGGIALVKEFEGFRSKWYKCDAGKDTIGYGHCRLPGDTYDEVTKAEAEAILIGDLTKYANQLQKLLKREPTQYQFDAMLSMVYNTGVGYQDGKKGDFADSDLLMLFNAGYVGMAADEFLKWTKYRDPVIKELMTSKGLLNRRTKERELFLGRL